MSLSQVNTLNMFLKNNYKTLPDLFTKKLVGVIFTKGFKYLLYLLKKKSFVTPLLYHRNGLNNLGPVPRKMIKFNPGLSQILGKVFCLRTCNSSLLFSLSDSEIQ